MKQIHFVAMSLFVILCAITLTPVNAGNSGASANGDFEFTLEDGVTRTVEFNARTHNNGTTKGEMTFTDPVGVPDENSFQGTSGLFVVKASFDCLVTRDNKAVMSGAITQASNQELVGRRVLLVVEDNGEGIGAANTDKLTWGVYEPSNRSWIPSDAEVPGDTGALLDWVATDEERPEDVGVPSRRSDVIGCQTFSIASYAFTNVKHGQGNIQIRP